MSAGYMAQLTFGVLTLILFVLTGNLIFDTAKGALRSFYL
jgi:hypothetical protein